MMLEVRHLKRVYRVKNADPVYALNDVTLKFPETGLVFILGKSGSGKSTLLNVMGGLDKADDGEIIINGKSSKSFTKGEMDSYRNTYLGFIFQEYNILSDFTVKENIALALQLQHKKATDEEVNKILSEVDLAGYGKRKPNELSGGQKQRVAIARALVKEPKIIFGDEPTGALDSNTGKQVFETLKKLSKTKLVVIVSHDRDFAEHFGDRVIELKDGKVISDISKTSLASVKPAEGVSLIGDNIIRLSKNRPLTVNDLPIINNAISKGGTDVFITADSHVNEAICEAAKIDKEGNREEFVKTDPSKIKEGKGTFKPIKSKFSLAHAFKMGSRSLRVKPFRLVMTILLSTIAFSLFGASLTLSMFSEQSALKSTIDKNEMSFFPVSVYEKGDSDGIKDEWIEEIKNTGVNVYKSDNKRVSLPVGAKNDLFHTSNLTSSVSLGENGESALKDFGLKLEAGKLPTAEKECAISLYAYYSYADLGFNKTSGSGNTSTSTTLSYEDVIGTELTAEGNSYSPMGNTNVTYTITGIIDTKLPEYLLSYRHNSQNITYSDPHYSELSSLSYAYGSSIHTALFVKGEEKKGEEDIVISRQLVSGEDEKNQQYYSLGYFPSHQENEFYFKKDKTALSKGEALVSMYTLRNIMYSSSSSTEESPVEGSLAYAMQEISNNEYTFKENYFDSICTDYTDELYNKYKDSEEFPGYYENKTDALRYFFMNTQEGWNTDEYKECQKQWIEKQKEILGKVTDTASLPSIKGYLPTGERKNNGLEPKVEWEFDIVGVDFTETDRYSYSTYMSISEEDATAIRDALKKNGYGSSSSESRTCYITFGNDENVINRFLDLYMTKKKVFVDAKDYNDIPDSAWRMNILDSTLGTVESTASMITVLTQVFLYVGIAMAVFSMLLFYNFISVSINNKKREIGILRAVGAKRSDVFKIFYSEAFIIAIINFVLSTIAVFVMSYVINAELGKSGNFNFDLMSPNILIILCLLGISLLASVISAFLPVTKIANKKPIDAIQNR